MRDLLKRSRLFLLFVLLGYPVCGQSDAAMMLKPWSSDWPRIEWQSQGLYTETQADRAGFDVDLSIFDVAGRISLDRHSPYRPTVGFEIKRLAINSADPVLPDGMTDVSIGLGGSVGEVELGEVLGGAWQVGGVVGLGYSGTNLFGDADGFYGKADLWGIKPIDQDTRWLVGLNYDGHRVFLPGAPLPVVSYFGRASQTVTYALGLPYSQLTYKPDDRWTLDLRSVLWFSVNGSVRCRATNRLELFGAYMKTQEAFDASGGTPADRRFLFKQQRVETGLVYDLQVNIRLTVAGGLAFDQVFERGYDSRDPSGLRDLDDSVYVRVGVEFRF